MNKTVNRSQKTFLMIGLALVAQYILTVLVSCLIFAPFKDQEALQSFVMTVGPGAALAMTYIPRIIGAVVFWLMVRRIPVFENKGGQLNLKALIQLFVIMYAVSTILNGVGTVISNISPAGGSRQLEEISAMVSTGNIVGLMIPILIAPIFEELVFRKLILDRTKGYGETTAIVFSALCFGLFHENLTQFLYAFCVGLFLGYIYCKTGKVLITMVMHMAINAFSSAIMFVLPLIGKEGASAAVMGIMIILSLMVLIMIALGIILLIRWIRKKRFQPDNSMDTCIEKKSVFRTVYLNPGVALYFVICTAIIITQLMNVQLFTI